MKNETKMILEEVKNGSLSVEDALLKLKTEPYDNLEFARVDLHRKIRQGVPEVIYGAGKTTEQMMAIVHSMRKHGQNEILITRIKQETARKIAKEEAITYTETEEENGKNTLLFLPMAKMAVIGEFKNPDGIGTILVATGGTSDIPIAEEAVLTAKALGNDVTRLYDVGVAGLHRLLSCQEEIMNASVIIAIAGMEGALASVLGGMADCPIIAVPTSVGYGASFHGLSALLSMLNSCASGVSVVNIDNGFGAGFLAHRINHMEVKGQ